LRDLARVVGIVDVLEQHGEFVAAQPREKVALAQRLSEAPADHAQQLVAIR
jgi:hypothetical protein